MFWNHGILIYLHYENTTVADFFHLVISNNRFYLFITKGHTFWFSNQNWKNILWQTCSNKKVFKRFQERYTLIEKCTIDKMLSWQFSTKMEIYAGKQPEGPFQIDNFQFSEAKCLCKPRIQTNHNITCDN